MSDIEITRLVGDVRQQEREAIVAWLLHHAALLYDAKADDRADSLEWAARNIKDGRHLTHQESKT